MLFRSVVSVAAAAATGARLQARQGGGPYPDVDFRQVDSWIVISEDNTATYYVGKTDLGQGTGTAFRQIMSDELDIAYENTSCVMGSTDVTVDQGGSGGSDALQRDGWPMRTSTSTTPPAPRRSRCSILSCAALSAHCCTSTVWAR